MLLLLALGAYAAALPGAISASEANQQVSAAEHDVRSLSPDTEYDAAELIERVL